jgi:hypothetical protein
MPSSKTQVVVEQWDLRVPVERQDTEQPFGVESTSEPEKTRRSWSEPRGMHHPS